MDIYNIAVLDLYLDTENPRHDPIYDQPKIIEQLVRTEKVKKLAQDIARFGINPLDVLAVLEEENGNYLVLEGNRRICALTLLNDPELAPPGDRSFFERLAVGANVPEVVPCVVFASREEVKVWLERRHNGPQDGAGLVSWNPRQKTRFFQDANTMAMSVLDYATERGIITEEERGRGILTTASRFLNNPIVRHTFGIISGRTEPNVRIDVDIEEFERVLGKFCTDLVNGENGVTSRTNKKDWEAYAKKLKEEGLAPSKHIDPYSLGSARGPGKVGQAGKGNKRNNLSADRRRTLIPVSCKVTIKNRNLKRIYDELRDLDCNTFPFAAAILCRAFLEDTYHNYYQARTGGQHHRTKTHVVLESCIKLLEEDRSTLDRESKKALTAIKRLAKDESNALSAANLGNIAHATYAPDPIQLKREWDNVEPILVLMLESV